MGKAKNPDPFNSRGRGSFRVLKTKKKGQGGKGKLGFFTDQEFSEALQLLSGSGVGAVVEIHGYNNPWESRLSRSLLVSVGRDAFVVMDNIEAVRAYVGVIREAKGLGCGLQDHIEAVL
jgi:hypothetical protein